LNENDIHVDHVALAIHFLAALGLLCYTLWFALKLLVGPRDVCDQFISKKIYRLVAALLSIQLLYGAFMAVLKAAVAAPTWPTINGILVATA
jgi:cytochrome c oxidase assembly protein subunit 15